MAIRSYDVVNFVNCSQRRTKFEMLQARYSVSNFQENFQNQMHEVSSYSSLRALAR